jgi:3-oxoacyl-[acyl-carrier protein] reductase
MAEGELKGTVALVTGAARGIGRAIALKLADAGSRVALNDLSGEAVLLGEAAEEIAARGGRARAVPGNVCSSAEMKTAVDSILADWGKIDILVNNAGITSLKPLLRITEEQWDQLLQINLKGAFLCSKLVLPGMIANRGGRIINIASVAGILGSMGRVDYAASKGGLIAFSRSLAVEVGSRNITVNAVAPGFIETRLTHDLPEEAKRAVLERTTLKKAGTPEDVAELVAFLAGPRAAYITGQVIAVDGGVN